MSRKEKNEQRERYYRGAAREEEHRKNRKQKNEARRRGEVGRNEKRVRRRDWDDADDEFALSIEKIRTSRSQRDEGAQQQAEVGDRTIVPDAIVVGVDRDAVRIRIDGVDRRARCKFPVAVGDEVALKTLADDHLLIVGLAERRSRLARPDPQNPERERVLAANVDVALCVLALGRTGLKLGLFDRFLLACARGGVEAALVINKVDLDPEGATRRELAADLERFRSLGSAIVFVSSKSGEGLDELRGLVRGRTAVLAGHSGVGKSSLMNALLDQGIQEVGAVRESDHKGRHTTVSSNLLELDDGTRLIDTPGVRAFGTARLEFKELRLHFPDFEEASRSCRYPDCRHEVEPDCGVREAVERGQVHPARFETYRRLLGEMD